MPAAAKRHRAAIPDPRTVEFSAMIAADALTAARTAGDHEAADRAEADLHAAVRRIVRAVPSIRAAITGVVAATPNMTKPAAG